MSSSRGWTSFMHTMHWWTYDTKFCVLQRKRYWLWSPEAGPWPSSLVVTNDLFIPTQCEGVSMTQLESPLRVENGLVKWKESTYPSPWSETSKRYL
jgi:hypothetical protein